MFIYLEGLPYVGKSTLAKGLKSRLGAGWKIMDGHSLTKEDLYVLRSGNCGNVILDSFQPYYELAKTYARSAYVPKSVLKEYQVLQSDNLTFDGFCNHFMESVNTMVVPEYIVTDDLSPAEVLSSVYYSVSRAIEAAREPKKALA